MTLLQSNFMPPSGTLDGYIDRMAKGDTKSLELLYRAAAPGVYAYALSILKNSHDAEDILQEAFLNIYKSAPSYTTRGGAIVTYSDSTIFSMVDATYTFYAEIPASYGLQRFTPDPVLLEY